MTSIIIEIIAIFVLLAVNGVFAMTEIAVVSARRLRLKRFADQGDERARAAIELVHSPTRFLSTVQIGITLVGIMAGAFGGATIAEKIRDALQTLPALAPYGEAIGLAIVVIAITYFSLVLGELVPKRIGLNNPERVAMFMAKPMQKLSVIARPLVNFLSASTDASLRVLGVKENKPATVTEEDVKVIMQEGVRSGAFNKVETQIVSSALELDQLKVRDIMTPRVKIIGLHRDDTHEAVWRKIVTSSHSFFPVYEGSRNKIKGIISVKAIYANLAAGVTPKISDLMTKPLVVPATQTVIQLLETFKQTGEHIALVTDEYGGIVGLVTLQDIMEAIIGDFPSPEERLQPQAKRRQDGSWLIDAMIEIEKLEKILPGLTFGDEESKDYQTLAGFVVKHLDHVPKEGEAFETQGYVFEILDMDRHRVSTESRYRRFFSPIRGLSEEQLRYFTEVDQENHVAWIGLDASNASLPGIGIARFIRMKERPPTAEVAFAVIDAFQGRGLGTALLAVLYLMARARGIQTLQAVVLAENTKIVSWLGHLGAHGKLQTQGVVEVDLAVQRNLSQLPQNTTARLFAKFLTQFQKEFCVTKIKHSSSQGCGGG